MSECTSNSYFRDVECQVWRCAICKEIVMVHQAVSTHIQEETNAKPPSHMQCKNLPNNCIFPECSCAIRCDKIKELNKEELNVAAEALKIVYGDRKEAYGNPLIQARRVCLIWEAILGIKVTPKQFELCMLGLKISREINKEQRDNLVDMCGYALVLEQVYDLLKEGESSTPSQNE
jgi:hypothetical protein